MGKRLRTLVMMSKMLTIAVVCGFVQFSNATKCKGCTRVEANRNDYTKDCRACYGVMVCFGVGKTTWRCHGCRKTSKELQDTGFKLGKGASVNCTKCNGYFCPNCVKVDKTQATSRYYCSNRKYYETCWKKFCDLKEDCHYKVLGINALADANEISEAGLTAWRKATSPKQKKRVWEAIKVLKDKDTRFFYDMENQYLQL